MGFNQLESNTFDRDKSKINKIKEYIDNQVESNGSIASAGTVLDIAIAVGIRENKKKSPPEGVGQTNLNNIDDSGVLKTLIEINHPKYSPEELKTALERYCEGGAHFICNQLSENKVFDVHKYFEEEKIPIEDPL